MFVTLSPGGYEISYLLSYGEENESGNEMKREYSFISTLLRTNIYDTNIYAHGVYSIYRINLILAAKSDSDFGCGM